MSENETNQGKLVEIGLNWTIIAVKVKKENLKLGFPIFTAAYIYARDKMIKSILKFISEIWGAAYIQRNTVHKISTSNNEQYELTLIRTKSPMTI